MTFPNYAGRRDVDHEIAAELEAAGINVCRLPESTREWHPEMRTVILGDLHGWTFRRNWYYWVCKGPGIELAEAEKLHATHGQSVRVNGHCDCPSPRKWFKGLACDHYHVDNQEGLNALAQTIRAIVDRATINQPNN